jgi:hypothetical protein
MTEKLPKVANKYTCTVCYYYTCKTSSYNKHITTAKHLRMTNNDENNTNVATNSTNRVCDCGKTYRYRQGLFKHRMTCNYKKPIEEPSVETTPPQPQQSSQVDMSVVLELLKQNQEFKDLLIEQNKQMLLLAQNAGNHNNNNNTNCNNKFNLNVFLNETCKDAITFSDFINSIEVTMDEFIQTGNLGFVNGISKVMMNRIKGMDLHTRPLHCTDLKRETVYIKNEEKWDKEDGDNSHLRKAVKCVAKKNYNMLHKWFDHSKPEVEIIGTEQCEDYFKFYKSALGGYDKEDDKKCEDKIIKNVLREVILDKAITDVE